MNAQTKLSAKGQVVIPKGVRERLNWSEGDRLDVIETPAGILLRRPVNDKSGITIHQFIAEMPPHVGPPVTLEEMNEAIDQALTERWIGKEARSR